LLALQRLLEVKSISAITRITNLDQHTITKLLVKAGEKCDRRMGRLLMNNAVKDDLFDENRGHVGTKQAQRWRARNDNRTGDEYDLLGIEGCSKLVLNFALGWRDQQITDDSIERLRSRRHPPVPNHYGRVCALHIRHHHDTERPLRLRASSRSTDKTPMRSTAHPLLKSRRCHQIRSWENPTGRRSARPAPSDRTSSSECRCAA
jgi:hypothetical protein